MLSSTFKASIARFGLISVCASLLVSVPSGSMAANDDSSCDLPGSGTVADPWEIDSATDMLEIGINDCISTFNSSHHYELTSDVQLSGTWTPIELKSTYGTSFDGNGYTISGLSVNKTGDYAALFATISSSLEKAEVKDLVIESTGVAGTGNFVGSLTAVTQNATITNVHAYVDGDVGGVQQVGGLIGKLDDGSTVANSSVHVVGTVNATGAYSAGGIGSSEGVVNGLYVNADVSVSSSGSGIGGGAIGQWSPASVSAAQLKGVSYVGNLSAEQYVGGLVGYVFASSATDLVIEDSSVIGKVAGNAGSAIGSFIGRSGSNISTVTVNDSYSSASFTRGGSAYTPALIRNNTGTITTNNVLYDSSKSSYTATGTATARTTGNLRTMQTFVDAGWSIQDVANHDAGSPTDWLIDSVDGRNNGYPMNTFQLSPNVQDRPVTVSFNGSVGQKNVGDEVTYTNIDVYGNTALVTMTEEKNNSGVDDANAVGNLDDDPGPTIGTATSSDSFVYQVEFKDLSGNSVVMRELVMTSIDVDGEGQAEFVIVGGISSYSLTDPTEITANQVGAEYKFIPEARDPTTEALENSLQVNFQVVSTVLIAGGSSGTGGVVFFDFTRSGSYLGATAVTTQVARPNYTISYDANGGTGTAPASQTSDAAITISTPALVDANGANAFGWNTKSDGTGVTYLPGASVRPSYDLTLYAQYCCVVTFDTEGGSALSSTTFDYGTSLSEPSDPTLSGYELSGWSRTTGGSPVSFPYSPNTYEDFTLFALWGELFDLSFDGNNEDSGSVSTIADDNSPTLPGEGSLVRAGFTFAGWNTQANGRGQSYSEGDSLTLTADTTIYAQWTSVVSATVGQITVITDQDVAVDASVTGGSLANDSAKVYEVTLAATVGTLTLSDETLADCDGDGNLAEAATGVYCSPGKLDVTEVTELKFRSNTTDSLNTVFDAVTFNISDQTTADLTLSISEVASSQDVYSFGGRYYEYVASSGITATAAETAAEAKSFFGLSGYLVNITSEAENEFVADEAQADNIWIGASDRDSEGNWAWIGGPEDGQVFFKDSAIAGAATYNLDYYNSWASGEPNDSSGEDYAVTNWNSSSGKWNDLKATNSGSVNGYFVEYGDGTEVSTLGAASASTTLSLNTTPAPYTGPVITDINEEQGPITAAGQTATVIGSRLSGITKAMIDGKEAEILAVSDNSFQIVLPDGLSAGTYDLRIESSIGNLTYLDAITIAGNSFYGEVSAWTVRLSDAQAKVYVKYPSIGKKIRISHQIGGSGNYETVFAKTLDSESDESLIVNIHGSYIVRTIDLEEINRIKVTVGDERVVQVRYNR